MVCLQLALVGSGRNYQGTVVYRAFELMARMPVTPFTVYERMAVDLLYFRAAFPVKNSLRHAAESRVREIIFGIKGTSE